ALDPLANRLYVANANSDTVSVIDTTTNDVIGNLPVGVRVGAPLGSAPNALALSPDGSKLYVADGASNALAIVDTANLKNPGKGLIPTGWFPTAVVVAQNGQQLYVASGYGFGSIDPPVAAVGGNLDGYSAPGDNGRSYRYRYGVVSLIDMPNTRE